MAYSPRSRSDQPSGTYISLEEITFGEIVERLVDTVIPKFKAKEEFWNTPLTTRPGKTARALMDDGLGEPSYSFEQYVSGPYGDRITEYFKTYALYDGQDMHPDVIAYWRNYGSQ